jgi:hypothetical protein
VLTLPLLALMAACAPEDGGERALEPTAPAMAQPPTATAAPEESAPQEATAAAEPASRQPRLTIPPPAPGAFRVATFNIEELSTAQLIDTGPDGAGSDPQALAAAAILQRVRPDVLVLNEIDLPSDGEPALNAERFARNYLAHGEAPIDYPHAYAAGTNTGLLSGYDLDGEGGAAAPSDVGDRRYGNDSFGFGLYPGQYAMAVLSRFPLLADQARTFQHFLWKELPGHHIPPDFYRGGAEEVLRLSSKSHWDLPLLLGPEQGGGVLHLFVSHPTPPVFDGPEDRNGRRNFDEIKFWVEYLADSPALYDDEGLPGGYRSRAPFVIAGDLNASPGPRGSGSGEVVYDGVTAIDQLLEHPRVQDTGAVCVSRGALTGSGAAVREAGPPGYPERATASFLGGRRVDYVLPSSELEVVGGGVFWPAAAEDPRARPLAERASDHRLVWVDLILPRD